MSENSQNPKSRFTSDSPGFSDLQNLDSATLGNRRVGIRQHAWRPPTDVYETEEHVHVRVEAAGMKDDDFSIVLDRRKLSIRGNRQDISERRAYYQMEIQYGEFQITLQLPTPVDAEKVEANYSNGFLNIFLPKTRRKQIVIKD